MAIKIFFRQYRWEMALLVALIIIGAGQLIARGARQHDPRFNAPVVYGQPITAVHQMSTPLAAAQPVGSGAQPVGSGAQPVPASIGQPHLELSSSYYDFGILRGLTAVTRDFFIINRGSAALVITQAYTTCGCTTALLTASIVPPGAAARATLTFNPAFHSLSGQTVRRGLILETNDPDQPEVAIWVQASLR